MKKKSKAGWGKSIAVAMLLLVAGATGAMASEYSALHGTALLPRLHVTLVNGFDLICDHRESIGERVRLYMEPGSKSFVDVAEVEILRVEAAPAAQANPPNQTSNFSPSSPKQMGIRLPDPTPEQLRGMMSRAGAEHNLDVDLLASVIRAESGGNIRAISRTGARGLMQLMPTTANELGVADCFHPEQNIKGGTAYLDGLLLRYHDDIPLALAAYNAGPAAVDRYHGIPPYRETRAYVNRVIAEFNRRKKTAAREAALALAASRTISQKGSATENLFQ